MSAVAGQKPTGASCTNHDTLFRGARQVFHYAWSVPGDGLARRIHGAKILI
ncbi:MAG: hypothetical protein JEZ11_06795 [Desulfobacterales bacterium]|nr:hypothetical protein [Desulfobacterales bacterium]